MLGTRLTRLTVSSVAAIVLALGAAAPSHAAIDMFLKLDGIPGDSQDAQNKGGIDVLAFSVGAARSEKKATYQNLSFTKYVDSSSPVLFERIGTGETIPTAALTARKAGEGSFLFLRYCLRDVTVTSVSGGGSGGEDRFTENVTLGYGAISMSYIPQGKDGKAGTPIIGGWDLVKNLQYRDGGC